jgi:hypothetical protein
MFRRNISPPSSGPKKEVQQKPASKQVASRIIRQPEIRVYIGNGREVEEWNSVPIGPEDGGVMFL